MTPSPNEVTQMLAQLADGNREVIDKLMPVVYDKLRELAANYLRRGLPERLTSVWKDPNVQLVRPT